MPMSNGTTARSGRVQRPVPRVEDDDGDKDMGEPAQVRAFSRLGTPMHTRV